MEDRARTGSTSVNGVSATYAFSRWYWDFLDTFKLPREQKEAPEHSRNNYPDQNKSSDVDKKDGTITATQLSLHFMPLHGTFFRPFTVLATFVYNIAMQR